MLRSLKHLTLALPLLAITADLNAQVNFTTPNATEYIDGNTAVKMPEHTSCYSVDASGSVFGPAGLYLSAWNSSDANNTGEFLWRLSPQSNPAGVYQQGSFQYLGVMSMEVAAAYNFSTNRMNIFVAYYKVGIGHFLDTYEQLNTTGPNPVNLVSTQQLSSSASYGRIRIDVFRSHYAVMVWEDPAIGLRTKAYPGGGAWSGTSTLANSFGETSPDVALVGNNNVRAHYVSYNAGSGAITESAIDINNVLAAPGIVTTQVEDVDYIGNDLRSEIVLDCPDLYDVENWAYTYTNGSEVFVRLMDQHNLGGTTRVRINSGILGNQPTAGIQKAFSPALHYGSAATSGTTGQITVGWYTTDGNTTNGYIALEMTEDGSHLLSNADYMGLPNAFTGNMYPYKPGIAFSRNTLHAPNYLYATYYDYDPTGSTPQLHHAFHTWGDVVFRGVNETGSESGTSAVITGIYPNPFHDVLHTSVVLQEDASVKLELLDMTGRQIWNYQAALGKGSHRVNAASLQKLSAGTYMLVTTVNGHKLNTQKVVKQ